MTLFVSNNATHTHTVHTRAIEELKSLSKVRCYKFVLFINEGPSHLSLSRALFEDEKIWPAVERY